MNKFNGSVNGKNYDNVEDFLKALREAEENGSVEASYNSTNAENEEKIREDLDEFKNDYEEKLRSLYQNIFGNGLFDLFGLKSCYGEHKPEKIEKGKNGPAPSGTCRCVQEQAESAPHEVKKFNAMNLLNIFDKNLFAYSKEEIAKEIDEITNKFEGLLATKTEIGNFNRFANMCQTYYDEYTNRLNTLQGYAEELEEEIKDIEDDLKSAKDELAENRESQTKNQMLVDCLERFNEICKKYYNK